MSTGYKIVCDADQTFIHLGQCMAAGIYSLGYGSTDLDTLPLISEYVYDRLFHGLRIVDTNSIPRGYTDMEDEYKARHRVLTDKDRKQRIYDMLSEELYGD